MPNRPQCQHEIRASYGNSQNLLPLLGGITSNLKARQDETPGLLTPLTFQTDPNLEWKPGKAWQYLVLRAFEIAGAQVEYEYGIPWSAMHPDLNDTPLEEIDGCAWGIPQSHWACLVEAKDTATPTSADAVIKLHHALRRRPANTIGCLFSTAGFTQGAVFSGLLEPGPTVLLWELSHLQSCIAKGDNGILEGLNQKIISAIVRGEYNVPL